jgi:hypothetical protein
MRICGVPQVLASQAIGLALKLVNNIKESRPRKGNKFISSSQNGEPLQKRVYLSASHVLLSCSHNTILGATTLNKL